MFTNNELKIMVPGCRVVDAKVMPDGSCVLTLEQATAEDTTRHHEDTTRHHQKGIFKLVPASKLSLNDDFLRYRPKTPAERGFMEAVKKVIKAGVQDFYRPTLDPSFNDDGWICYRAGMKPAVGKSYNWWYEHSKMLWPERKSRLGTKSEYIAFLAVFIKEMVASGKSLEWAWNAVCNNSKELGHYWNCNDATHNLEATGNREVCGWRDLANTCKILAKDKEHECFFWMFAGNYSSDSNFYPLADLYTSNNLSDDRSDSTGWIVLT